MNIHALIEEYLAWKSAHRLHAGERYKYWVYRFVEAAGEKPAEEYTVNDLLCYQQWISSRYSYTSLRYAMAIIKNFFEFLKMKNIPVLSPKLIPIPRFRKANSHLALAHEDFKGMIRKINPNTFFSLRDLLIMHMLWDTGMRVSELCDLNLTDIDKNCTKATVSTKKTSNMRVVVWSLRTTELLLNYLDQRNQIRDFDSDAVFIGKIGKNGFWSKRLTTRTVQRMVQKLRPDKSCKVTPHGFRHGWAHVRRDKGAPLPFIQRGLGHVSPVSSFVYQQYSDPEFETSARAFFA